MNIPTSQPAIDELPLEGPDGLTDITLVMEHAPFAWAQVAETSTFEPFADYAWALTDVWAEQHDGIIRTIRGTYKNGLGASLVLVGASDGEDSAALVERATTSLLYAAYRKATGQFPTPSVIATMRSAVYLVGSGITMAEDGCAAVGASGAMASDSITNTQGSGAQTSDVQGVSPQASDIPEWRVGNYGGGDVVLSVAVLQDTRHTGHLVAISETMDTDEFLGALRDITWLHGVGQDAINLQTRYRKSLADLWWAAPRVPYEVPLKYVHKDIR